MKVSKITTDAEADNARNWREQFAAAADHLRSTPEPFGVDPELWKAQADACQSMVDQFDAALATWAKRSR